MPYWVTWVDKNGTVQMRGGYQSKFKANRKLESLEDRNVPDAQIHFTITSDDAKATRIIREKLANNIGVDRVAGNFRHKPRKETFQGVLYSEA